MIDLFTETPEDTSARSYFQCLKIARKAISNGAPLSEIYAAISEVEAHSPEAALGYRHAILLALTPPAFGGGRA
jgi:hypothetical protein